MNEKVPVEYKKDNPEFQALDKKREKDIATGGYSGDVVIEATIEQPANEAEKEKLRKDMEAMMQSPPEPFEAVIPAQNVKSSQPEAEVNPDTVYEENKKAHDQALQDWKGGRITTQEYKNAQNDLNKAAKMQSDWHRQKQPGAEAKPASAEGSGEAKPVEKKEIKEYSAVATWDELFEVMFMRGRTGSEIGSLEKYREDFNKYHTGKEGITVNSSLFDAFTREGGFRAKIYELLMKDLEEKNNSEPQPEPPAPSSAGAEVQLPKTEEKPAPQRALPPLPKASAEVAPAQKLPDLPKPPEPAKPAENKPTAPEKPVSAGDVELKKPEAPQVVKEVAGQKLERKVPAKETETPNAESKWADWTRYAKVRAGLLSEDAREIIGKMYEGSRMANMVDRAHALFNDRLALKHEKAAKGWKDKMDKQLKKAEDLKVALKYEDNPSRKNYLEELLEARMEKADGYKEKLDERDAKRVEFEEKRNDRCNKVIERLNFRLEPYDNKLEALKGDRKELDDVDKEMAAKITEREKELKELKDVRASLPFIARLSVSRRIRAMEGDINKWAKAIRKIRQAQASLDSKIAKADKKAQPIRESKKEIESIMKRRQTTAKAAEVKPVTDVKNESTGVAGEKRSKKHKKY